MRPVAKVGHFLLYTLYLSSDVAVFEAWLIEQCDVIDKVIDEMVII
jgi:hypothetical protein